MTQILELDRPAFWTEPRDPEAWLRALEAFALACDTQPQTGTPRTVAERCLTGILSWRGAVGLFGVSQAAAGTGSGPQAAGRGARAAASDPSGPQPEKSLTRSNAPGRNRARGRPLLHGVGLITQDEHEAWILTEPAEALLRTWRHSREQGLTLLAGHLVRESPWLRLLLLRLLAGDWRLEGWPAVRAGRGTLKTGTSLILRRCAATSEWLAGMTGLAAGPWLARTDCSDCVLAPELSARKKGKDDLSLAPLTAPLHLLETAGWLSPGGALQLPGLVLAELNGRPSAATALTAISARRADLRGFVPIEPTLRELLAASGHTAPGDGDFARWMDELLASALSTGAIEILAAEPGQTRHGRGLSGDPASKLVRWVVHEDFDTAFQRAWHALENNPQARPQSPDEELTP